MPILTIAILASFGSFCQNGKAETELLDIMRQHEAVGLSVVVVRDGNILYSKAFGLKDIEENKPLADNDIFRIASISKSFSATAIMRMVEARKVSLDDDFGKLVGFKVRNPKFPDKVITLKMVLSHTSSINDSQGYFNLDVINPAKNPDWVKCYNDYAPGDGYEYCNLNFNMVGTVIERLAGERFDMHIKRTILQPLGLYGGYCIDSLDNNLFTTLYEYDSSGVLKPSPMAYAPRTQEISGYRMGYSTPVFSPTGGMKISAPDLAKYMIMHMNYGESNGTRIISRRSSRLMQKSISKEEGYGLALMNVDNLIEGRVLTGHTGSAYGLYSAMFFHPKDKFGFVVITNGCNPAYSEGMNKLLSVTMKCLYKNYIQEGTQQ